MQGLPAVPEPASIAVVAAVRGVGDTGRGVALLVGTEVQFFESRLCGKHWHQEYTLM